MKDKPTRCIDPVMKFCQECRYGWIYYPDGVKTYKGVLYGTFESGCVYGLENAEPTEEELKRVEEWYKGISNERF